MCTHLHAHHLCPVSRSVGETSMNLHSSRSHTIFTIVIESQEREENEEEGSKGQGAVRISTLVSVPPLLKL